MDNLICLEANLKEAYDEFITSLTINKDSGIINQDSEREIRFAGYAYIGKHYCDVSTKILFYGLDLGSDELIDFNTYHNFETRRNRVVSSGDMKGHHPVICSLYMIALGILGKKLGLNGYEQLCEKKGKINSVISKIANTKNKSGEFTKQPDDILKYVAFSNIYKFVTKGRENKPSGYDRVWYSKILGNKKSKLLQIKTKELLMKEIKLLAPDIVIVMTKKPYFLEPILKSLSCKYIIMVHPSAHEASGMVYQLKNVVDEAKNMTML